MLEKGELSFIFLWVLNPIVILFYQNCSSVPLHSKTAIQKHSVQQKADMASSGDRWPACVHITASKTCAD